MKKQLQPVGCFRLHMISFLLHGMQNGSDDLMIGNITVDFGEVKTVPNEYKNVLTLMIHLRKRSER